MKALSVTKADSRKKIRDFIFLPSLLHKHHLNWIPPIYADEWRYLNELPRGRAPKYQMEFIISDPEGRGIKPI